MLVRRREASDPVLILGHWRSGTTLLHERLALDAQVGFSSSYACFAPGHFLVTERILGPVVHILSTRRAPCGSNSRSISSTFMWRSPRRDPNERRCVPRSPPMARSRTRRTPGLMQTRSGNGRVSARMPNIRPGSAGCSTTRRAKLDEPGWQARARAHRVARRRGLSAPAPAYTTGFGSPPRWPNSFTNWAKRWRRYASVSIPRQS